MEIENAERKAEIMKTASDLSEDVESLELFKNSGLKPSQLKAFVNAIADRANQLEETLLLDSLLDEAEKKEADEIVKNAQKKTGTLQRAFSYIPDETSSVSAPNPTKSNTNHLRKLDLPKYGGDIRVWTQWWGRFEASVHNDDTIDKGLKLQYFEGALEDDALNYLSGFSLAPSNYDRIIQAFKTRFSNVDLLSQAYHRDLEAIPECTGTWKD